MLTRVVMFAACVLTIFATPAAAQRSEFDGSEPRRRPTELTFPDEPDYVIRAPLPVYTVRDVGWDYIDSPLPPRKIQLHDIISIVVDEKSEVTLRSTFNRQRMNTLKAQLKEFIRWNKGAIRNSADTSPTIDADLQGRMQNSGIVTDQEGIRYRIAATVVNVHPNGNVVLEAVKTIRTDTDVWHFSLTGIIASQNIRRDMTALSENIANLDIVKSRSGKVYDSTKVRWGVRLYDLFWPF